MTHYAEEGEQHETAFAIAAAAGGDAIVTGRANQLGEQDQFVTLRLAAADGEILWLEKTGGPDNLNDVAYDVVVDGADDVVVTGVSVNVGDTADFLTVKYDGSDGRVLWERRMPGAVNNQTRAGWLALSGDDVIMVNRSWILGNSFDVVLQRYAAADGAVVWESAYNGPASGADDPRDLAMDQEGQALVAGVSDGDFMTLRFDTGSGDLLWEAFHDGPMGWYDLANCVVPGPDGSALVAGFTDGGESTWDATLVALDLASGDELWHLIFDGADGLTDEARSISLSDAGDLYVAGYSYAYASDMDMLALRYLFAPTAAPGIWTGADPIAACPNPFRASTRLGFAASAEGFIELAVYDVSGRCVKRFDSDEVGSGRPLLWDGTDLRGREVPAGLYLIRARTASGLREGRVLRLR